MKTLTAAAAALALIIGGWLYFRNGASESRPQNSASEETVGPADLVAYSNADLGFSIMRPADSTVSIEGNGQSAKIMLLGPEALPNTEITDGFTVTVTRGGTRATSTEALAEERMRELEANGGEVLSLPEKVSVGGMSAEKYSFTTLLGNTATEYIFLESGRAYFVATSVYDPGEREYERLVSDMLETISFE